MQKYKITATKNQKKYSLVLSAETQKEAQEKVHKEGYSILKIEEYDSSTVQKNKDIKKFVFVWKKSWEIKRWVIMWEDILKLYIKLRDELEYDVQALYPKWDTSFEDENEVQKLLNNLRTWYDIQKEKKTNIKQKEKKQVQTKEQSLNSTWVSNDFYLKKQLESIYELIEMVILKFTTLFKEREKYDIDDELYNKLQEVYVKIISLKSSTNLPKLREIGELSLIKIAEVELRWLQSKKTQELQDQLKETNRLLKKIWSKEQFKDPDTDLVLYIKNKAIELYEKLKVSSIKEVLKKDEKKVVDTETYEYLKLILQLEKYEKKLKEVNKIMLKSFYIFLNPLNNSEEKIKIVLKKKVIEQNIAILKAKKAGRLSSYTSVKKWFNKVMEWISDFLKFMEWISLTFIMLFSYLFLIGVFFSGHMSINTSALPYFLLFFLFIILTEIRRHIVILFFYIVFFAFSFIFIQVNF